MKRNKSILIFVAILVVMLAACVFAACDNKNQQPAPPSHTHDYVEVSAKQPTCVDAGNTLYYTCECGKYFDADKNEIELSTTVIPATGVHTEAWVTDVEATCLRAGSRHKQCSVCGQRLAGEEAIPQKTTHTFGDALTNGKAKCTVCGAEREIYKTENGKFYFGSYPQSKVEEEDLKAELSEEAGALPTVDNSQGWTKYLRCYENGVATYEDDMWYIDVEYGGAKYRGVYFLTNIYNSLFPELAKKPTSDQQKNGYEAEVVYWFKWEPIEWVAVKTGDGKAMLLANVVLEGQYLSATDDGYKNSSVRQWLNENFYKDAFDYAEAKYILKTMVDNSAASTSDPTTENFCEDTEDNVFLLSSKEVDEMEADSLDIKRKTTGYAEACGAYTVPRSNKGMKKYWDYGNWSLRSQNPDPEKGMMMLSVMYDGYREGGGNYYYKCGGIVPALWLTM